MSLLRNSLFALSLFALFLTSCQKDPLEPDNLVPKVDAGTAQSITVNTATLTGSASDSDGRVVAYLWSQVSGPSKAVILNEGSASTSIKELVNGTYVFQLMATDNDGATGVDTVSVKVTLAAGQTVTFQPANNASEYILFLANDGNSYFLNGSNEIPLHAWTNGGIYTAAREVLKFDLAGIPANATIVSARLYLYSHPGPSTNGNKVDANWGSTNAFYIKQITGNWNSSSFTWTNEPATTNANQVYVPHTNEKFLDLDLDVKGQVASMVANNANYGFYIKLENEVVYNSRIFVSSFNPQYPAKRPKLVVTYQ